MWCSEFYWIVQSTGTLQGPQRGENVYGVEYVLTFSMYNFKKLNLRQHLVKLLLQKRDVFPLSAYFTVWPKKRVEKRDLNFCADFYIKIQQSSPIRFVAKFGDAKS